MEFKKTEAAMEKKSAELKVFNIQEKDMTAEAWEDLIYKLGIEGDENVNAIDQVDIDIKLVAAYDKEGKEFKMEEKK